MKGDSKRHLQHHCEYIVNITIAEHLQFDYIHIELSNTHLCNQEEEGPKTQVNLLCKQCIVQRKL